MGEIRRSKITVIFVFTFLLLWHTESVVGYFGVCLSNCVQCKEMFGMYFHGRACAESCIKSRGLISPDCNNPNTLRGFLKRYHSD
ncbi:hypothetical protein M8J77_016924 [Diaphorina citri]|nr:hypothetical protein M8J77_016924 [Diaphorina citri]